jgi:septal ring factor EnvC (AmiA/AmiB activator)
MNFRSGIDIKAERGEPIRSVCSGKVLYASWFKGYGNIMIIDHGDNYYTVYGHIEELLKSQGDHVQKDEIVATVGDAGSRMGTKLYFEVRHHGKSLDPLRWLKKG